MVYDQPTDRPEDCLIVRADATVSIGTGHVMRCLALAEGWVESNGRAIFAMAESTPAIEQRLRCSGMDIHMISAPRGSLSDADETVTLADRENASSIVMDGYDFDPGFQNTLRRHGAAVLCVDDNGRYGRYDADLVLNQNVHAQDALYADRSPSTRLLLGPRYALLRREFREGARSVRTAPELARRILVTFGGTDSDNVTGRVIDALASVPRADYEARVLVGGSNPHLDALERAVAPLGGRICLFRDPGNLPELMAWSDFAIGAAGTTTLELAYLGVPMLLLVLADTQVSLAQQMQALGAARNLGWARDCSRDEIAKAVEDFISNKEERARFAATAREIVDGQGALRVADVLRQTRIAVRRTARLTPDAN